jgi:hypothetical protein
VVLLLTYRFFTKGFDQSPPHKISLDDVLVALGEAGDGAGLLMALVEMFELEEANAL